MTGPVIVMCCGDCEKLHEQAIIVNGIIKNDVCQHNQTVNGYEPVSCPYIERDIENDRTENRISV